MKNIGIVGGGIVGLCSAWYLVKSGHRVTIIDQGDLLNGCSFGNAGMIVPSHFIPLAAPGMISKGMRWMFNSRSPFYIRPRLSGDLVKWGYLFYRSSTSEHVTRSIPVLKDFSLLSKAQYQLLSKELPFDFGFRERGLMMLYQTAAGEKEEIETAHMANQNGIEAQVLNSKEVQEKEPDIRVTARGGIYFPGDAHVMPQLLVSGLITELKDKGVTFLTRTRVTDFIIERDKVKRIVAGSSDYEFDEVIVASGSWSDVLCSKLKLSLPLQAGKGYSFNQHDLTKNIRIPSIFTEARVAVTPMGSSLRFGGTMEIGGLDSRINMNRVRGITDAIPSYYPEMLIDTPVDKNVWHGFRPCSPDGLPYVGRMKSIKNVTIATGHSMMGLSLGPGTGKLISEIINEEKLSMDIQALNPDRFN